MRESGAEAVFVHATTSHSVQLGSRSVCEFVARGQNRTCDVGLSEIIAKFHYTDTDPHGPNGVSPQTSPCPCRARVVEFSSYPTTWWRGWW